MKLLLALVLLTSLNCHTAGQDATGHVPADSSKLPPTMSDPDFSFYIPWGPSQDALPLVLQPAHGWGEAEPETRPALPAYRLAENGRCMALNFLYGAYAPASMLRWFHQSEGKVAAYQAPLPFQSGEVLEVDFYVAENGGLLLLEKVSSKGEVFSRMASLMPGGELAWSVDRLPGDAFSRIIPGIGGGTYLLRQEEGNELFLLGENGQLGEKYGAEPGSRLAFALGLGAALDESHLAPQGPGSDKVGEAPDMPDALYYLFGFDREGNYYAYKEGTVQQLSFEGQLVGSLDLVPALERALAEQDAKGMSFPGMLAALRLDADGRVYVPCLDGKGFRMVRLGMD